MVLLGVLSSGVLRSSRSTPPKFRKSRSGSDVAFFPRFGVLSAGVSWTIGDSKCARLVDFY